MRRLARQPGELLWEGWNNESVRYVIVINTPLSLLDWTWLSLCLVIFRKTMNFIAYFYRDLLHALPSKLLLNLSISLVLLLVTFLAGVEQTEPRIGCQIIASLIQYFILTTFSWMGIEAFNMYRSFVKVFDAASRNQSKFMKWSSCIAWG